MLAGVNRKLAAGGGVQRLLTAEQQRDYFARALRAVKKKGADPVFVAEKVGYNAPIVPVDEVIKRLMKASPVEASAVDALSEGRKGAEKHRVNEIRKAHRKGRGDADAAKLPGDDELDRMSRVNAEVEKLAIRDEAQALRAQRKAEEGASGETYVDVAALGENVEAPKPTAGSVRDDGVFLFYSGEINALSGVPGAFKTGTAALSAVETLKRGGKVWWADLDFNGAQATVARLLAAGADLDVLRDRERFRLTIGESPAQVLAAVEDAASWLGDDDNAVMDSAGELVAMFGGNSNDADDWTRINRQTLMPLAAAGAAVVLIDHQAKTAAGTGYATGTGAKKRTLGGAFYELAPFKNEPPRPEAVGKVALTLLKDRHGGTGYGVGECVAVLELDSRDAAKGPWLWRFMPARPKEERAAEQAEADVAYVLSLDPFPSSRAKLHAVLVASQGKGWRTDRENAALEEARKRHEAPNLFPIESKE